MSRGYNSAITTDLRSDAEIRLERMIAGCLWFSVLGLVGIILGLLGGAGLFTILEPNSVVTQYLLGLLPR